MSDRPTAPDFQTLDRRILLDAAEAGVLLHVTEDCVKGLHYRQKSLHGFCVGNNLRFHKADVIAFAEGLRNGNGSSA